MARSKSDKAFDERVAQYSEELRELLTDLYGEQADEAFRNLTELMAKARDARPADLKRLDTKRLADPEWYKRGNMFGMTMYTDLFAGDLKKLADKVPYLKEQKLTYLHLMPLLKMPHPQNDGGYAVEDFDTVDPSLGTNEDLAALTKKLRAAGISLCGIALEWRLAAHGASLTDGAPTAARLAAFDEVFLMLAALCARAMLAARHLGAPGAAAAR